MRTLEEKLAASQDEAADRLAALTDVMVRIKPIVDPPLATKDQETETVKV